MISGPEPNAPCRLAEVAGGLSLASDLADGFPEGKVLRTATLAVELGRAAGFRDETMRHAYFLTLIRFLGCTGFATEEAHRYGAGDDIRVRSAMALADGAQPLSTVATIIRNVGSGSRLRTRVAGVARLLTDSDAVDRHARAQCDASASVARSFGLDPDALGVRAMMERWDGKGATAGLRGEALPPSVRLLQVADVFETRWHRDGFEAARAELKRRKGKHLDPQLVEIALREARSFEIGLKRGDDWERFLAAEPEPHVVADRPRLLSIARAIGRVVDLKSTFTFGHSERVARLARAIGTEVGLSASALESLELAGYLHDLGRLGVPNRVWDKPGPLSLLEREHAERHTLYTERALRRAPALASLADVAASAHERGDGRGYHRRLSAGAVARPMRILAVADVAAALGELRPHRPPFDGDRLSTELATSSPGLDAGLVEATLAALPGGTKDARRSAGRWPRGLSDREVDVLQWIARGKTYAETASILGISPRTVQNHLASAYDKLGVSSRAGAAIFMMEEGLL